MPCIAELCQCIKDHCCNDCQDAEGCEQVCLGIIGLIRCERDESNG
jgi:hypothetical protein